MSGNPVGDIGGQYDSWLSHEIHVGWTRKSFGWNVVYVSGKELLSAAVHVTSSITLKVRILSKSVLQDEDCLLF